MVDLCPGLEGLQWDRMWRAKHSWVCPQTSDALNDWRCPLHRWRDSRRIEHCGWEAGVLRPLDI